MLKLKSLTLESSIIQSPMAGCTDLAYRLLSRSYGMEFCFLEMVAAESLVRGNEGAHEIMKTIAQDKPLGAQIVGCRPEAMGEAAAMIESMGYDLLDINFGCPVPKVAGKGAGSALLEKPAEAKAIFTSIMRHIKKIPVTVKMRLGVQDASGIEAARIAKIAQDCGLSAVTVHGRTRAQGYSGNADYHAIAKVKEAVQIPIIGNGDIHSGKDALRMKEITGCDGVMIGRGGLGNPWIFKEVQNALDKKPFLFTPGFKEKKEALLKHLALELLYRDERSVLYSMRRIACWYFKNIPGVNQFRTAINTCMEIEKLRMLIENFEPLVSLAGDVEDFVA